jgi:hypothetical protein
MKKLLAEARVRIDEFVEADLAMAVVNLRDLLAGVEDETPEYNETNDRMCDIAEALPLWLHSWAERASWRDHGALWEAGWILEDLREAGALGVGKRASA